MAELFYTLLSYGYMKIYLEERMKFNVLNISELARKSGVSRRTIERILKDIREGRELKTRTVSLRHLATALEIDPSDLYSNPFSKSK
jgi:transcriptional regulator with XRE-family HTH domain